jgi:hypothetical protein
MITIRGGACGGGAADAGEAGIAPVATFGGGRVAPSEPGGAVLVCVCAPGSVKFVVVSADVTVAGAGVSPGALIVALAPLAVEPSCTTS